MRSGSMRPPGEPKAAGRPDRIQDLATMTTRWADNDAYGHVNNTVYYEWFDSAVNAWMVEQGMLDIAKAIRLPSSSRRAAPTSLRSNFRNPWKSAWPSPSLADRASAIASASSLKVGQRRGGRRVRPCRGRPRDPPSRRNSRRMAREAGEIS